MRNHERLMRLGAALSAMMCLMSCQTVSSNAPEVVEETAIQLEADRCEDLILREFPGGPAMFEERWASLPEWAQKYLLAQDAAWEKACGEG